MSAGFYGFIGKDGTWAYGCVECQQWHYEAADPVLYAKHLMRQSKHGVEWRPISEAPASRSVGSLREPVSA